MGLLTDPAATKELAAKIEKYSDKLGKLGFIAGIIWLILQSTSQFNSKTYIDENALLPGLALTKANKNNYDFINLGNCLV